MTLTGYCLNVCCYLMMKRGGGDDNTSACDASHPLVARLVQYRRVRSCLHFVGFMCQSDMSSFVQLVEELDVFDNVANPVLDEMLDRLKMGNDIVVGSVDTKVLKKRYE